MKCILHKSGRVQTAEASPAAGRGEHHPASCSRGTTPARRPAPGECDDALPSASASVSAATATTRREALGVGVDFRHQGQFFHRPQWPRRGRGPPAQKYGVAPSMAPVSRCACAAQCRHRLTMAHWRHVARYSAIARTQIAHARHECFPRLAQARLAQVHRRARCPQRRAEPERAIITDVEAAVARATVKQMVAPGMSELFVDQCVLSRFAARRNRPSSARSSATISSGVKRSCLISALRTGSPSKRRCSCGSKR